MRKPSPLLLYFSASLVAALFISYQAFSKEHISFSLAFTRLTSSRLNNVILANCLFACLLVTTTSLIKFFFGEMREIERYDIIQWTKQKVLSFAFMTVVLHDELITSQLMILFVGILAWSIFHWLAIKRSEYLIMENQSNHIGHIKISILFLSLAAVDMFLLKMFYEAIFVNKNLPKTDTHLIILIAFEVLILLLKIGSPLLKYFINLIELLTLSHFEHKSTLLSVAEFLFTITALISELLFFYFIYQTFGTPLHLILEAIETIMSLVKTTSKFYTSIALVRKLNKLPDITEDDIKNIDSTCLICLHEITSGKKIPCGHIFHLSCLKGWIQGNVNQFCPKCKQPIKIDLGASAADHDHMDPLNPINPIQQQQQQANIQNLHNKVEKLGYLNFGLENVMVMKLYNEIQLNYIDKDEDQFKSYQDVIRRIYSDILNATEEEKEQIGALEYGLPRPAVSYRSAEIDDLRKKSKLVNYLLLSQFGNHQFFKLKPNEPLPKPAEEKEEPPQQAATQPKPMVPQAKSDLSTILKKASVPPPELPKETVALNAQARVHSVPAEEKQAPVQKEETEEDAVRRRRLLLEAAEKRFQNNEGDDDTKSPPALAETKKTQ